MPGKDIFPSQDAIFDEYVDTVVPYLTGNALRLNLSADNNTLINGLQAQWDKNWMQYIDITQRTSTITATKRTLRKKIETALRSIFNDMPRSALTIADRETFNLKERNVHGTRVAVESSAPVVSIALMEHMQHTLRFQNPLKPSTKALPEGQKILLEYFTGAPNLPDTLIAFANDKYVPRFKATVSFTSAQLSLTCYYRCCYENTHGERSPWSATVTAVVA